MNREDTGPICIIDPDGDTNDVVAAEWRTEAAAITLGGANIDILVPSRPHQVYRRNDLTDAYWLLAAADDLSDEDLHVGVLRLVSTMDPADGAAMVSAIKRAVNSFTHRHGAPILDVTFVGPRRQLVVAARPMIIDRVRSALQSSTVDWRTPPSLARQLGVSEAEIRSALKEMAAEVRHPIAARDAELDYYRLSNLGKTWQERVRWLLLLLGRTPPNKIR
jgi:hypothetical protein